MLGRAVDMDGGLTSGIVEEYVEMEFEDGRDIAGLRDRPGDPSGGLVGIKGLLSGMGGGWLGLHAHSQSPSSVKQTHIYAPILRYVRSCSIRRRNPHPIRVRIRGLFTA